MASRWCCSKNISLIGLIEFVFVGFTNRFERLIRNLVDYTLLVLQEVFVSDGSHVNQSLLWNDGGEVWVGLGGS